MTFPTDTAGARCTFCNEVGSFPHRCKAPDTELVGSFPHRCKLATTELVATFQPDGESGKVAVLITAGSMENLWAEIEGWADDDVEGPIGVITLERKPVGHVASLPEHPGW